MKIATILISFLLVPQVGLKAQPTYSITGAIQIDNIGVEGVQVFLGGALEDSVSTDTRGEFTFSSLPEGSYTVTPRSSDYQFTPASLSMELAPGISTPIPTFSASPATSTGIDAPSLLPELQLLPNFPNPFGTSTEITVVLNKNRWVKLDVFDVLGRHVATLAEGSFLRGRHVFSFAPRGEPAGLYLVQLTGETQRTSRIMTYRP